MQSVALVITIVLFMRRPGGHGSDAAAPSAQNEPLGHLTQAVPPPSLRKVPAAQSVQMFAPLTSEKEPGEHCAHASALPAPRFGLALPATHATGVRLVEPAAHQWPTAHGPTHCALVCPGTSPYRPAAQSVAAVAPLGQNAPAGQPVHSLAAARLVAPEKVPPVQGTETLLPAGQ